MQAPLFMQYFFAVMIAMLMLAAPVGILCALAMSILWPSNLLDNLQAGERRSIGTAETVARLVLRQPSSFKEVIPGLSCDDPGVRMRAAHVIESVTRDHPEWLQPYTHLLLERAAQEDQHDLRWRLAVLLSRVELDATQRESVKQNMLHYLDDENGMVTNAAMKLLAQVS